MQLLFRREEIYYVLRCAEFLPPSFRTDVVVAQQQQGEGEEIINLREAQKKEGKSGRGSCDY